MKVERNNQINVESIDKPLIVAYGSIVLILVAIVFAITVAASIHIIKKDEEKLSRIAATTIADAINKLSFSGKFHTRLMLEELRKRNPDIAYVLVSDFNGNVIAHTNPHFNDRKLSENSYERNLLRRFSQQYADTLEDDVTFLEEENSPKKIQNTIQIREYSYLGNLVKEIALPYLDNMTGGPIGVIYVGISVQSRDEEITRIMIIGSLIATLMALVAVTVIVWVSGRFAAPVRQVAKLLETVTNAIADPIYFKTTDGRYLGANDAYERLVGLPKEELIGHKDEELGIVPPPSLLESINKLLHEHKPQMTSYWLDTPNGRRFFLDQKSPLLEKNGELFGYVSVARDITEQKELEESLQRANNELMSLNMTLEERVRQELAKREEQQKILIQQSRLAAMGEMIGNIAHQWRQPLNSLGILIQDLNEAWEFGELDHDYLTKMINQAMEIIEMMSRTIDDFRDFFRPDKEAVLFSINDAVKSALSIIGPSMRNHNITIELIEKARIEREGHPNEYAQVILNLLKNASDALLSKPSDTPKKVRITIDEVEGRGRVVVSDNGPGVTEEIKPYIFEPYFTTKAKTQGTGIGLYMSKKIIEQSMGGHITLLDTKEEGGASFEVVI
ncbi:MAG: PAS domain-containing sensor histidine kinase [Campylobacterales bacterium]